MTNSARPKLSVSDRFQALTMEDAEQHLQSVAKRAGEEMERIQARQIALDEQRETISGQLETTSEASIEAQKDQNIGTAIAGLFGFGPTKAHKLQMETARLQAELEKAEIGSARLESRAAELADSLQQAANHMDRASGATQGARQDGQRKTGGGKASAVIAQATELQGAEAVIASSRTLGLMERSDQMLNRIDKAADERLQNQMQAISDRNTGFSLSRIVRAATTVVGSVAGATSAISGLSLSPILGTLGPLGALAALGGAAIQGAAVTTITLTGTSSLPNTMLFKAGMDCKAGHLDLDAEQQSNSIAWAQEELDDTSNRLDEAQAQADRIRKMADRTNSALA